MSELIIAFTALLNLGLMAIEYIDCPFPYFPIPYGCWCGVTIPFPPEHDEPIDTFDSLCKTHDYCYEDALAEVNMMPQNTAKCF